jgi:tRNA A-37 threonylcarbamoyl transferase component Bud32
MPELQACPDAGQFRALLDGMLTAAEQEWLQRHVEQCEACQRTLEQVAASSWEQKARQFAPEEPAPALLQKVIREAQGLAPETQATSDAPAPASGEPAPTDELSYLAPPARAGDLGRLDHYEFLAVLGKGGFGTVFKARDEKLDRLVAIKVLSPALAGSGTARRRFIREARAAAGLHNDHVIAIHGVSDAGPVPYLVMELISGVSLQNKLDARGPLDVKEVLRIGMQTAQGLAAAHQVGLVHRDIKPPNILLENGVERVKITDFGLARAVDDASVTQSGTVAGTPMYMSPEQAEGLAVDHRSDLFSLGSVLYALCAGHPPFRASGTHAVLKRVIEASPRPIPEINRDVPNWLCDIIVKLHAKSPEDRFQTAGEVAELLGQYLAHLQQPSQVSVPRALPVAMAGSLPARGTVRPARRRMLPWFGAAGFVVALLAASLILLSNRGAVGANEALVTIAANQPGVQVTLTDKDDALSSFVLFSPEERALPPGTYRVAVCVINCTIASVSVQDGVQKRTYPEGRSMQGILVRLEKGRRSLVRVDVLPVAARSTAVEAKEEGWVQLFNGMDLSGWNTARPDKWRVFQGLLVGAGNQAHLRSQKTFADFHCRLEAKIVTPGNAHIDFRDDAATSALVQLTSLAKEEAGTLSLYANARTERLVLWNDPPSLQDGWFRVEIVAVGKKVTIKVNGIITAERAIPELPDQGTLNLAIIQKGVVHFRKIEVKELPPSKTTPP